MSSFIIHGLSRFFAASVMESRERRMSSYTPSPVPSTDTEKDLSDSDLDNWDTQMRWLVPFAQATGYQIVIENPKSHERIVIDQNTEELPSLTLEWMKKYNKEELLEWIDREKGRERLKDEERQKTINARRIAEARGRAKFGDSYTPSEQDIQDAMKSQ